MKGTTRGKNEKFVYNYSRKTEGGRRLVYTPSANGGTLKLSLNKYKVVDWNRLTRDRVQWRTTVRTRQ
jgi:hypothetical protein